MRPEVREEVERQLAILRRGTEEIIRGGSGREAAPLR